SCAACCATSPRGASWVTPPPSPTRPLSPRSASATRRKGRDGESAPLAPNSGGTPLELRCAPPGDGQAVRPGFRPELGARGRSFVPSPRCDRLSSMEQLSLFGEERPAKPPAESGSVAFATIEEARAAALGCVRCDLSQARRQVVFGTGRVPARLMIVG